MHMKRTWDKDKDKDREKRCTVYAMEHQVAVAVFVPPTKNGKLYIDKEYENETCI